ncbi:MAG: fimbria major subunit [Muribaculaceae bacterium]|nr:fimbria major subunit [Muribaculaceae bacterium]
MSLDIHSIYKLFKSLILTLLLTCGLFSCVDDSLVKDSPTIKEGDTPYIMKIRLTTGNGSFTRATESEGSNSEFEDGADYEYAIGEEGNFCIIFDAAGQYISCADLYSVNESKKNKVYQNSSAVYTTRFYGYADRPPGQILVVVNATHTLKEKIKNFPGWNVDEAMKLIDEKAGRYVDSGDSDDPDGRLGFGEKNVEASDSLGRVIKYFTMTNATYLDTSNKIHCAETITRSNYAIGSDDPEADMEAAAKLEPVTIFLERMVAKMLFTNISFATDNYIPPSAQPLDVCIYESDGITYHYEEYKWGIQLLGWGMNGLETQNYLFKNIDTEGDWLNHSFNAPSQNRCYWSHDPHYAKGDLGAVYPWQHDDARDQYDEENNQYYSHFQFFEDTSEKFALTYYPFKKFCNAYDEKYKESGYFPDNYYYQLTTEPVYTPENTFQPGMTVDRSRGTRAYELAGTHVIVAARLLFPDDTGNFKPFTGGNIYRNRVGVSYKDEYSMLVDFIHAVNYKLESNPQMYYKYYDWDASKTSASKKDSLNNYRGVTMRAAMEGKYSLYAYFPNILKSDGGTLLELTPKVIEWLLSDENQTQYKLTREADAINSDGKVIPWISEKDGDEYVPLKIMVLKKTQDWEDNRYKGFVKYNAEFDTEYMIGNPNVTNSDLETYLRTRMLTIQKNIGNNKWKEYDTAERDDNDIQSLFYEIWGAAECFHYGMMYYAVPIYAQDPNSPLTNYIAVDYSAVFDPSANQAFKDDITLKYYYGVVRDNWYQFTLHSITDIGVPVSDPSKPIIPNYNDKKDQVKFEMEIIGMHTEDQTVVITD